MIKNILSVFLVIAFSAIFYGTYVFFSEAREEKEASIAHFTKLTNSLFISPLSQADLQALCDCDITPLSYQPLSFTLRTKSRSDVQAIRNPQQLTDYEAAQVSSTLKICGLIDAKRDISIGSRGETKTTTYSGIPFTSEQCENLWVEGRAYFEPVPIQS